jgi:hypothetical protein
LLGALPGDMMAWLAAQTCETRTPGVLHARHCIGRDRGGVVIERRRGGIGRPAGDTTTTGNGK